MERVRDAFLILLRAGLWGHDPMEDGCPRLESEEWKQVFRMSARQTVTGIVFDGICRLPEEFQPVGKGFAEWVAAVDRIERDNERMNSALRSLVGLFVDAGLEPVLQKGQGIAELYPVPSHRECGDIDLYFKLMGRAEEIIRSKGIEVHRMPDGSLGYRWQGVEVEHHPDIVDLCGPFQRRWIRTLSDEPGTRASSVADGLQVPSTELNALMLNAHILKHAMGKGVGLRQMCDLAMVYHRVSGNVGRQECGERIFCLYRRAWIQRWSRLLHSFLVGVIGLPEEELPYREKLVDYSPLMRIVEEGGNFGQHRPGCFDTSTRSMHREFSDREDLIRRKLSTAGMFVRRAGFSLRFAPNEAFWTVVSLAAGQFKSREK